MFVDSTNGCSYTWHESNGVKKLHSCLSMGWNKIIINVSFFILCHGVDDALHASPTSKAGLPLTCIYDNPKPYI